MPKFMCLPQRIILLMSCSAILACSEEQSNNTKTIPVQTTKRFSNNTASPAEDNRGLKTPLINILDGKLEIRVALDGDDNRSKIIRFAKITDKQQVAILQSGVYIQNAINNQAKLAIKLQLAYQPKYDPNDMTDLTIVSNQFTHQGGGGFHWSGAVEACKNSSCSVSVNTLMPEIDQIPEAHNVSVKEMYNLSIVWDEDTFEYLFSFNDVITRINMRPYVIESQFDIGNFRYASLSAEVSNVDSESDSGRIVVRFGEIFVNGHLYDDFSSETLNPDYWVTGQINQLRY